MEDTVRLIEDGFGDPAGSVFLKFDSETTESLNVKRQAFDGNEFIDRLARNGEVKDFASQRDSYRGFVQQIVAGERLKNIRGELGGSPGENDVFGERRFERGGNTLDVPLFIHVKLKFFSGGDGVVVFRHLEDVVVVVLEREGAKFVNAQLERIALDLDANHAIAGVFEITCIVGDRVRWMRAGLALTGLVLLGLIFFLLFLGFAFPEAAQPINGLKTEEMVEHAVGEDVWYIAVRKVCQDDDADVIIGQHGKQRVEAVNPAVVPDKIVAAVSGDDPSETVREVPKLGIANLRRRLGHGGLRTVHQSQIGFGDNLFAVELAIAELEGEIPGHIVGVRVDGAGGTDGVNIVEGNFRDRLLAPFVRGGVIFVVFGLDHGKVRMSHAEGRENILANATFPSEASQLSFEIAHGHDSEVVVLVGLAETLVGF